MSHYYDTPSRAEDRLPSERSAPEEHHSLTPPPEPRGFLLKAYSLMYVAGLAWLAAIGAWAATLVRGVSIVVLSLSWTAVTSIGSRPDEPDLSLNAATITLAAAVALTVLALVLTFSFRRMINASHAYAEPWDAR